MPDPVRRRTVAQVSGTRRSAARSLWRTARPTPPLRFGWPFLREHVWPWVVNYLKYVFRPRWNFPHYTQPITDRPGVFPLLDHCRVALAGDWGTGTDSAAQVAKRIRGHEPDVTIHLRDVYYSGTAQEYQDYFLAAVPHAALMMGVQNVVRS